MEIITGGRILSPEDNRGGYLESLFSMKGEGEGGRGGEGGRDNEGGREREKMRMNKHE